VAHPEVREVLSDVRVEVVGRTGDEPVSVVLVVQGERRPVGVEGDVVDDVDGVFRVDTVEGVGLPEVAVRPELAADVDRDAEFLACARSTASSNGSPL
jgi:hypothetical protein